jgi:hypothetical protein
MYLNGRLVVNAQIDGVDHRDYPDYSDAYFSYAEFADNGAELTESELEELTEAYPETINEMAYKDSCGAAEDLLDYLQDR